MKRIIALPGMGDRLAAIELMPPTPEELAAFMKAETDRWGALIRQLGLKARSSPNRRHGPAKVSGRRMGA